MSVYDAIETYVRSISESARNTPNLHEFFSRILPVVSQALHVDAVSIFLADRAEESLFLVATTGLAGSPRPNEVVYRFGEGLTGWVAQMRQALTLEGEALTANPHWRGKFREFPPSETRSFVAVPMIWYEKQVFGVIRCVSAGPMPSVEDSRVQDRLEVITSLLTPYVVAIRSEEERVNTIERVTHELKSSLVAIKNAVQMIPHREQHMSQESRRRLEDTATLCDMLMASAESKSLSVGKDMAVRPIPCLLYSDILMPVVRMLQFSFERRVLNLVVAQDVHQSPRILADPQLLRLVVYNLLDNALKYSSPNTDVRVDGHIIEGYYKLTFSNYGVPIPSGEGEKIFLIGYRSTSAIGQSVVGQGLGLYTCRLILHRLGGTIALTCTENPVSFTISLPTDTCLEVNR